MVALLGCDQGAHKASPPPPTPRDAAVAEGTIRGTATHTMSGPGRYHRPEESFSTTSGMACSVTATDAHGVSREATTNGESGSYEIKVPVGHHVVSFQACASTYCYGGEESTKQVDVTANGVVEASFHCEGSAK